MAKPITYNGQTWTARAITANDLSFDSSTLASMAKKYGVSAEQIADANDVEFTTKAINEWVMEQGGKMVSAKYAGFVPGGVIFLPEQAGAASVAQPGGASIQSAQVTTSFAGLPWWAWAGAGAVGVGLFLKSNDKDGAE